MSSFEINKIVGAVLAVALVVMVIGMIGDVLVKPKDHDGTAIVSAAPVVVAKKEEKKLLQCFMIMWKTKSMPIIIQILL